MLIMYIGKHLQLLTKTNLFDQRSQNRMLGMLSMLRVICYCFICFIRPLKTHILVTYRLMPFIYFSKTNVNKCFKTKISFNLEISKPNVMKHFAAVIYEFS